jgi:hypothetical protein
MALPVVHGMLLLDEVDRVMSTTKCGARKATPPVDRIKVCQSCRELGYQTLDGQKQLPSWHQIVLTKLATGLEDLYSIYRWCGFTCTTFCCGHHTIYLVQQKHSMDDRQSHELYFTEELGDRRQISMVAAHCCNWSHR